MQLSEPHYPGFTKARADWKEDPNCRACGRPTETVNSLTGVMCEECFIIWYDSAPPDGDTHWNSETLGNESRRRQRLCLYPYKGNVGVQKFEPDGVD